MKTKKKVGEIFREEFKAVETTPPDDVWNNIQLSLEKNRKRRLGIPFWYKAAGIAAVFAIMMGILLSPDSEMQDSTVTEIYGSGLELNFGNTSFENFDRIMRESSVLLRTLVLGGREMSPSHTKSHTGRLLPEVTERELLVKLNNEQNPIVSSSVLDDIRSPQESLNPIKAYINDLHQPQSVDQTIISKAKGEEEFFDRISVSTAAGILYSGNLGKENFVDRDLSSYSSQGETSVSYSFRISYRISDKLEVRTGLSSMTLQYITDEVGISSAIAADAIDVGGMDYDYSFTGDLHQNLGFLEVPMELSYALVKKQLSIKIIGGASALFLEKNSLSLDGSAKSVDLGAANNLNEVSFSGNMGLGISYNLQDNFHITFEPVFKYNLNTFNNASSGMDPYVIGIYSGILYRF